MSAPLRRKVEKPPIIFTLVVEAQEMIVIYRPEYKLNVAHFELRSPYEPPRPFPLSETGYRSHFVHMDVVNAASSPEDYARDYVLSRLRSSDD